MSTRAPSTPALTRRGFLAGVGALGATAALGGCATTAATASGGGQQTGGTVTLQSNLSSPQAKTAMQALVAAYNKEGTGSVALNTVASETFRTLLPTYLSSANPPDVYTWYAGNDADHYASQGLLLDVSSAWTSMTNYAPALKTLSTDAAGKQIFVPTDYYWWGVFYRKSQFAAWGLSEPTTWSEFIQLCETIKSKNVVPIGLGAAGADSWVASGWFDYFNIRINGAPYHRALLQGQRKFTDPQVVNVFNTWKQALPYFDPNGTAVSWQDASTQLLQGKTAMLLTGTFFADAVPAGSLDDLDFFKFPVIDPSVPDAEEAPTDGLFASARTHHASGVIDFMRWMATPAAQNLWINASSGSVIPANPQAKDSGTALIAKGKAMLAGAADLTQFFNRDSTDALQTTADTALINFIQKPNQLNSILSTWQTQAEQVWKS